MGVVAAQLEEISVPIHISMNDDTKGLGGAEPNFGSLSDLSLTPESAPNARHSTNIVAEHAKKRARAVDPVEIMERLGLTRIK